MLQVSEDYRIALYLRLSRDDKNGSLESMSIDNQRKFLLAYVHEKGWEVAQIYADVDAPYGQNANRP